MTGPSDSSVQVEALKSCPHCGGKAAFVPRAVNLALQKDPSDPKFGISVICGTCSAETGNFIDQAAAAKRWNRRAALPVAPSDAEIEEAKELATLLENYQRYEGGMTEHEFNRCAALLRAYARLLRHSEGKE